MEFALLGPLVVCSGGSVLPVTRGNQRVLLAVLLLGAGRVVPVDDIAETLWGAVPPPSAPVTIRNYVRRLRQSLSAGDPNLITARQHGYLIKASEDELDIRRFEGLAARSRTASRTGAWDQAATLAQDALSLWRGEPLADITCDALAMRERPRLTDLRLQALETRAEAGLRLGHHSEVLAELQPLTADHPLREHLQALLMVTLYRCGRRADALAAFHHVRAVVVDELGVEPSRELRKLQQQILAADPALDFPEHEGAGEAGAPTTPARLSAEAAVTGPGPDAAPAMKPVPRQLPPVVAHFTGRESELTTLTGVAEKAGGVTPGTTVITALSGPAGVGKTGLAIFWAHQVAKRFPDGQLYANLRGFDESGLPANPAEVVREFLDAFGVAPERIPRGPDAQAGLLRTLLAGRRMLIVLDNAHDEQQVRPLLPASPGSLVLITSRHQLTGLAAANGAQLLTLDILSAAEATQMLTVRLGTARATAEPDALLDVAELCSRLPLALAVAAARAAARPGFRLAALAAELRDSSSRLDALDTGDPAVSVRAVFSWSYQRLSPGAMRLFRLLGLHTGLDISASAVVSLASISQPKAGRLLSELTRAHLIAEHRPDRYAFHDLLRAYATSQAHATDGDTERRDAIGRLLDHYLHTASSAARLLRPSLEPVVLAWPRRGALPGQPADYSQALAWFEEEHQNLLAAVTLAAESGFDIQAWQLPWAMTPFLSNRGHWQERGAIQRTALTAATRLGDTTAQALSGRLLANACTDLGHYEQARSHYASSLTLYQALGNRLGEAKTHQGLSEIAERQDRYADALAHAEQALQLYQVSGDKALEADTLNAVGWCHGLLGDFQQAREFCRQALTLGAEAGNHSHEGHAWDSLGYAEQHLGNLAEAAACYLRALPLHREFGDRFHEADTLTHLGDTRHAAGQLPQALDAWQRALNILNDLRHPDADKVRARLAAAGHGVIAPAQAATARSAK